LSQLLLHPFHFQFPKADLFLPLSNLFVSSSFFFPLSYDAFSFFLAHVPLFPWCGCLRKPASFLGGVPTLFLFYLCFFFYFPYSARKLTLPPVVWLVSFSVLVSSDIVGCFAMMSSLQPLPPSSAACPFFVPPPDGFVLFFSLLFFSFFCVACPRNFFPESMFLPVL